MKSYHMKQWTDREGDYVNAVCQIEKTVHPSDITKATETGETWAPLGLPQGNVGTPTSVIKENITILPSKLLSRLGLSNSSFHRSQRFRRNKMDFREVHYGYEEEKIFHDDDDDGLEEWDRHTASHPELEADRGLRMANDEQLYEHDVENPWDKQDAQGLVYYTDASYWEINQGEFDERVSKVDDFDVEDDAADRLWWKQQKKQKSLLDATKYLNQKQNLRKYNRKIEKKKLTNHK